MAKNKTTLSEQLYDVIYEDIVHQRLNMGQKLTLKNLSEKYEVSYTPIREALSRLTECGLVEYYSNCGVSVVDFTDADIQDIFRFAGELDALAILYCRATPTTSLLLFELRQIVEESNRLLSENKTSEWKQYSQDFHKIFYKYAQSTCLSDASRRLRPKLEMLSCLYYNDRANVERINREHIEIYETISQGDYDTAAAMMRDHLQYDTLIALQAFHEYKSQL